MNFSSGAQRDIWSLICGKKLGRGIGRKVYEYLPDPTLAIKIEDRAGSFQNVAELQIWQAVRGTEFAKWFAPVEQISASGTALLMRRTEPVRRADLPDRLPAFFTDLKQENFGMLDGRLVVHDYGSFPVVMLSKALTRRMARVDWSR